MSIVAITAVNKPAPQASAADSAATDTAQAAGGDFASLLFAQLTAGIQLVGNGLPAKAADAANADATDTAETVPPDAAALFAALGIIPPDTSAKPVAQANDSARPAGISELRASARKSDDGDAQDTLALDAEADERTAKGLPAIMAAADDKPAKFAVGNLTQGKATAGEATPVAETRTPTVITHAPTQQATSGTPNSAPLRVETPLHEQKAWASDFGQKIVWMAGNDKQSAQLTLNPPQMGPIEISLNINRDSATALFVSANPEVREAIESALPRLREMLAGAGIELGQANVSAESPRQQQGGNDNPHQGASRRMADNAILGGDSGEAAGPITGTLQRSNSLVDLFA